MRESIDYAIKHEEEALRYAQQYSRGLAMDRTRQFVRMYVNEWTQGYGPRGRQAVGELLRRAHAAGLIPQAVEPEFVG
jgi:1,4-dihydroxy-6-naphthoate synthase